ncbi:matrin 3-like 1.1 isoform X5 [Paralichthys olivaceus]|uniref:matrin 3-like 1.1 isoform X5 n=1 Tax=Paralichthys olivaceus TaxID=8255 RepID=UPI00375276BC
MSHKYRPPDSDLRPDPAPYSSDRRHTSLDRDNYRPPQASFSPSYPSSSSSRGSAQWSQEGALSILSSCGLEPSDLSLLAELPEDVLTVESLPHVLNQLKGKRGTVKPFSTNAPSFSSSSSHPPSSTQRSAVSSSSRDWDQLCSQPVQYPLGQVTSRPLPSEKVHDHWGNPTTSSSVRADPLSFSSSSSSYMVDFHHRPGPSDYGKTGRASCSVSSRDPPSVRSAARDDRTCPSRLSESGSAGYRSAPPPEEHQLKAQGRRPESETSSIRSSRLAGATSMPTKKEALDFHGRLPEVFPYSCSLCDITVLSERVWTKHINGTYHADGQLSLLQQFPKWDCRMETLSRADNQSEKSKNEEKPTRPPPSANESQKSQSNKQSRKKTSDKSKVVCVKFPAQSVDETYLRKLTEPFGKILKILMFPSLAFVELGSIDQAKDLVKFHINCPPTVNGEQMEFSISNTFSFLQSSRVVSFTPAPTGEDGRSDLISIVKRFGQPLYTLFLPSMVFVEMKNVPDAQKLVDYYSAKTLRINSDLIKVSLSGEYRSLMRVASATRYEEETPSTKTASSRSQEQEDKTESKRKRPRSRERSRERSRAKRSRSSDDSNRERKSRSRDRSRSRDKSTEKTSRDESNKEKKSRSRSRSRDKPREKRSRSREKSCGRSSGEKGSREKTMEPEKSEKLDSDSKPEPAENRQSEEEEEEESSAEDSDIEGMEVIGEDGENVDDEEEEDEEDDSPAERSDSIREEKENVLEEEEEVTVEEEEVKKVEEEEVKKVTVEEEEVKKVTVEEEEVKKVEEEEVKKVTVEEEEVKKVTVEEEASTREREESAKTKLDEEEGPDFPVDLENCITLDELEEEEEEEEQSDDSAAAAELKSPTTRVIFFKKLPLRFYTDAGFVQLVKGVGTAVRYFLIRRQQQGFIEMSTSAEAVKAAQVLNHKTFHGSRLFVNISHKYTRLVNGYDVQSDSDMEKSESRSSRRRDRISKSRTSDRDEARRKSESRRESGPRKTPERESGPRKTPERESGPRKTPERESGPRKTPERESGPRKTPERESGPRKTPERESGPRKTPERESGPRKTPERESGPRKTPERESGPRKTPERESGPRKTPERESGPRKTPERESGPRKTPERESGPSKTPERESGPRKTPERESGPRKTPERESGPRKTPERESGPRKTPERERESGPRKTPERERESGPSKTPERELLPKMGPEDKMLKGNVGSENKSFPDKKQKSQNEKEATEKDAAEKEPAMIPEDASGTSPDQPQTEQKSPDSGDAVKLEQPVGGIAESEKPTKPVGTKFVRPVVGYFCHLCQVIYADEEEAKLQHCSSLTHYRKYQVQTSESIRDTDQSSN